MNNKLNYKVGDRVRIKSLDWYNKNKDEYGSVSCPPYEFLAIMCHHCGTVRTISSVDNFAKKYKMTEDGCHFDWTDEMIEGLAEEENGTALNPVELKSNANCITQNEVDVIEKAKTYWDSIKDAWVCPEGYQFVDENGNIINATKIVLEKKKKEYPKTYEECCKVLNLTKYPSALAPNKSMFISQYKDFPHYYEIQKLAELLICRDAYWKIYGEEMGLEKPWKPEGENTFGIFYDRLTDEIEKQNGYHGANSTLEFPTEEMRDAFYENFKKEIENCKELL